MSVHEYKFGFFKFPLSLVLLAALVQGCVSVDGELNVLSGTQKPLAFVTDDGTVSIPPGSHPVQLSVAKSGEDPSELVISDLQKKVRFFLPDADKLLATVEPLPVDSAQLGQPVSLAISRKAEDGLDIYTVTFMTDDRSEVLGKLEFKYKSNHPAYDEKSKNFLFSFQEVRRSQRGVVVPIDGEIIEPLNSILNHSGQVLLAPWLYARYTHVEWMISSQSMEPEEVAGKWKSVISETPVVDYMAFNHAGSDYATLEASAGLGWKDHQLRFVYTEGCGSANSSYFETFLGTYGAAVAIGHRDTSASPFFAFPLVHSWTYGNSALDAAKSGWSQGAVYADIVHWLTLGALGNSMWQGREDMIHQSELGVAWTSEMTPDKLDIDTSAVLTRDSPESQVVHLSFLDNFGKDIQLKTLKGENLPPNDSPAVNAVPPALK